jgi:5'(3')-deoxyribonucleotidase
MGRINKEPHIKIIQVDLDGVVADFDANFSGWVSDEEKEYRMSKRGFWWDMPVKQHSIPAMAWLQKYFDVHFCSTAPWDSPVAWTEKRMWVERHFPSMYKKLTLTHHKNLIIGDYLIDDRDKNGAAGFQGELIPFGTYGFETWAKVCTYLAQKELNHF